MSLCFEHRIPASSSVPGISPSSLKKFHGHPALAIASYNAGPQAVSRWVDARPGIATDEFIEEIPYKETRHYVKKVLSNYSVYRELNSPDSLVLPQQIATNYLDNIDF